MGDLTITFDYEEENEEQNSNWPHTNKNLQ